MNDKYYVVVIDKALKTLEVRECKNCLSAVYDELMRDYNMPTLMDTQTRFKLFWNDTNQEIDFDAIYKYAKKYTVIEKEEAIEENKINTDTDKYIGIKFLGYDFYLCEVIKHYKDDMYLVKNSDRSLDNGMFCEIMTIEDIDDMVSKQEKIKAKRDKYEERRKQQEENERLEREHKMNEENLYGFDNGKRPMQKAKILKCLLTKVINNNEFITRKELVINKIHNGYKPIIKQIKGKSKYTLSNDNYEFYECTKIEYDFAYYLLDNYIIKGYR